MGTFNTYGNKSRKYGGAYPVWLSVLQKERAGGMLAELPPVGTIIRAGTLVSIDGAGGKAEVIPTFRVSHVSGGNVKLETSFFDVRNIWGFYKIGSDFYSTAEWTISKDDLDDILYDEIEKVFTLVFSTSSPPLKIGDILYGTNGFASDLKIVLPTGLTENDVWIEEGDTHATVASVFHGEIMEDRIQPIPECVKRALPMIKFVKGI